MNKSTDEGTSENAGRIYEDVGGRLVYVLPNEPDSNDEVNLLELCKVVWAGKWLIISVTTIFAILSLAYALTATQWYRAEIVLLPARDTASQGLVEQLGGLGGLASLAGLDVGSDDNVESIAVLRSRDFIRSFIEEKGLVPVLIYEEWDEKAGRWKTEILEDQPDVRDAIKFFHEDVRKVTENTKTGLVTLSIDWTDPEVAASWAGELVARLNDHMRQRALSEAEQNVAYLREQLETTNISTLRETIGSLLETEMQNLMLAKGTDEFAFRIVDSAQIPKERLKPKRVLIVALAVLLGAMVAVFIVFVRHASKLRTSP